MSANIFFQIFVVVYQPHTSQTVSIARDNCLKILTFFLYSYFRMLRKRIHMRPDMKLFYVG